MKSSNHGMVNQALGISPMVSMLFQHGGGFGVLLSSLFLQGQIVKHTTASGHTRIVSLTPNPVVVCL